MPARKEIKRLPFSNKKKRGTRAKQARKKRDRGGCMSIRRSPETNESEIVRDMPYVPVCCVAV